MTSFTCITAGEWRNLCSVGRIRLHESRAVSCSGSLSEKEFFDLLSVAPERFSIGETSDFLITEYTSLRSEIEGVRPPGIELGVWWLLLEDVLRFLPLRNDDAWVFDADAEKAGVVIGQADFEGYWQQWFNAQIVDQACINGSSLVRTLGLGLPVVEPLVVPSTWRALAERIVSPDSKGSDVTPFAADFLKKSERLFDLVREDSDSASIFVSCPAEWVRLWSKDDIFESNSDLLEHTVCLHDKYSNKPFASSLISSDDLTDFFGRLRERIPGAFPEEWIPETVTLYIRCSHRIKLGLATPDEITAAVDAIGSVHGHQYGRLLAFLLGVTLGANKTHSLARQLRVSDFSVTLAASSTSLDQAVGPCVEMVSNDVEFSNEIEIDQLKETPS
jgi:hypothetical protein